jgi:protein TonB
MRKKSWGRPLFLAAIIATETACDSQPLREDGTAQAAAAPVSAASEGADAVEGDSPLRHNQRYNLLVDRAVANNLRYPPKALSGGDQGSAWVQIRMQRDGTILGLRVFHSSGHKVLDEEALLVFARAGRMPPVPDDLYPDTSTFQLTYPINFVMN